MSQPAAANDDQPTGAFAELWQILRDLGRELIEVTEAQIDQTLALNHAAGRIRKVVLRGLTGLLYLFLCWLLAQPRWSWEELARRVGSVATNRALEDGLPPLLSLGWRLVQIFLNPEVLLIMLALVLPFALAFRIAAAYLGDIFEVDPKIARRFISQAAFSSPEYLTLRIEEGGVNPEDQDSPLVRIGGPGKVVVNLENAAVFERTDGSPEFIGPTFDGKGFHTLEGFERLRAVIDLRDHTLELQPVKGRTKDGVPIKLNNARLLFSVLRRSRPDRLKQPYPFEEAALHWLVYNQKNENWWVGIRNLVNTELSRFIGDHTLGEILAAVGTPEIQRQLDLERTIQEQITRKRVAHARLRQPRALRRSRKPFNRQRYTPLPYRSPQQKQANHPRQRPVTRVPQSVPPPFVPRPELSRLFYDEFVSSFPVRARANGVHLEWIDVGSWASNEIIPAQHLEAWKLTTENALRGNTTVLTELGSQARVRELVELLQAPLFAYRSALRQTDNPDEVIDRLLQAYHQVLVSIRDRYSEEAGFDVHSYEDDIHAPIRLVNTLEHIRRARQQIMSEKNNSINKVRTEPD